MTEIRLTKLERGETKIQTVPIAVTPEGFWCCPTPVGFPKTMKSQIPLNKSRLSSPPQKAPGDKKRIPLEERKTTLNLSKKPENQSMPENHDHQKSSVIHTDNTDAVIDSKRVVRAKTENLPRKLSIEFGELGTSDMKVVLLGKHGLSVKLNVHKNVILENSSFFADRLAEQDSHVPCLKIDDCEDVEIYAETVGLMYCRDMKQRLIKQSVQRVLQILKVAGEIGFSSCIQSCLEYLEAVPWVGEEEEEMVISSVLRLHQEIHVKSVLKRVCSDTSNPAKDTLSRIIEMVLKSGEERGRHEIKSTVLKLLRENSSSCSSSDCTPPNICHGAIYSSCRSCLNSLVLQFRQAAEPSFGEQSMDIKEPVSKQIALDADNLSWLLEILADGQAADKFALMWACQRELASLHEKVPIMSRYHVSCVSARLFVGIGRGELLPSKETRLLLLQTWLQPLIDDYRWLLHGFRPFDRKVVDEGIGRTILTLPLEEQQSIMISWLGSFLKAGDHCPNLQIAFEVWWRRTFIRPYAESLACECQFDNSVTSDVV